MNNLREIYNNILTNIEDIYLKPNSKINTPFIGNSNLLKSLSINEYRNAIIDAILNNTDQYYIMLIGLIPIMSKYVNVTDVDVKDLNNIGGLSIKVNDQNYKNFEYYNSNNNSFFCIPVYVVFMKSNVDNIVFNNKNINEKLCFVINIICHSCTSSANSKFKIKAHELFFRQFDYKQFSVNIFNHIYQPSFELITDSEYIKNEIHNKYLIDYSSMGSIFSNDPVNKYLFGLPKFDIDGIKKDHPDVYKILQDQGVNYRKVISSKSHNPFK